MDTALREAAEETHLDHTHIQVICTLPPQSTMTTAKGLTIVTPVVALLKCPPHQLDLSPNPAEVACLYWVPLQVFCSLDMAKRGDGLRWNIAFFFMEPETKMEHMIYGFTAFVCISIAAIALNSKPNFHFEPYFISKLKREGDFMAVTSSNIIITQRGAREIGHSKL